MRIFLQANITTVFIK